MEEDLQSTCGIFTANSWQQPPTWLCGLDPWKQGMTYDYDGIIMHE